jgi:hypothetical protein
MNETTHTASGPLGAGPILWRRALVETFGPQCTPWGPPLPRAAGVGRPERLYYQLIDALTEEDVAK